MAEATARIAVQRYDGTEFHAQPDLLAVEEPLEIRLAHGPDDARTVSSISVTMRTPGHDTELAVGFLMTEGVLSDEDAIDSITVQASAQHETAGDAPSDQASGNAILVSLTPGVDVNPTVLQRNFYTTSSCGVCGKASLLALRTVCPPRRANAFSVDARTLCELPASLRAAQAVFARTGGLHAAGVFTADGKLEAMREDVGRHNAVDKLLGAAFLAGSVPLRDRLLLLSGRASFELLQKALMAGIPMVASVGAPSSLAVRVAREFDMTLVGFLRDGHFNVYHGASRVLTAQAQVR